MEAVIEINIITIFAQWKKYALDVLKSLSVIMTTFKIAIALPSH